MKYEFQTFKRRTTFTRRTQHYFRIVETTAGKIVAQSEGYNHKLDMMITVSRLQSVALMKAKVIEVEK
jgi:uncharacterized protein YegP (UPF0339 family)